MLTMILPTLHCSISCSFLLQHHSATMLHIFPSCSTHAYLLNSARWSVSQLLVIHHDFVTLHMRLTINGHGEMSMATEFSLGGKWCWQG